VKLTGTQARAVGRGIAEICPKIELIVHACAIMPDHVHLVVASHKLDGDDLIACLKRAGSRSMNAEGIHPFRDFRRPNGKLPSPWAGRGWKVALYTVDDLIGRIRYVEQNPIEAGFKRQHWSFVTPFSA
jgi:REP element-mobilizing transposase RayT